MAASGPCVLLDDAAAALLRTPLKYSRWSSICILPASTAAVPPIASAAAVASGPSSAAALGSSAEAGAGSGSPDAAEEEPAVGEEVGASMRHARFRFLMNGFGINSGPGPRFAAIIDRFDLS